MTNFDTFKRAGIRIVPVYGLDTPHDRLRLKMARAIFALDVMSGLAVTVFGESIIAQFRAGELEERVSADDMLAVSLDFDAGELEILIGQICTAKGPDCFMDEGRCRGAFRPDCSDDC